MLSYGFITVHVTVPSVTVLPILAEERFSVSFFVVPAVIHLMVLPAFFTISPTA